MLAKWRTQGIFACLVLCWAGVSHAQLKVTAVQWVQGRDDIPHPALNGRRTMLQAIAEGGNCGGNYTYRWDINGDTDYDDPNEGLRNASAASYAGYFAQLGLDVQYPDQPGDTLILPRVEVTCGAERATATMPVLVRVERICPGYPQNENCVGDQNLGLTRSVHADRAVDRALWWMFTRFAHRTDDGQGHAVHTCWFSGASPLVYGTGHALNAFLRRGHGHGEGRESDVYYRHATQCGIHAMLTTMQMRANLHFDDPHPLGPDGNRLGVDGQAIQNTGGLLGATSYFASYEASAWVEPIASFGNPDYVAPAGNAGIHGRTLRDIGQDLADGLLQCAASDGGWYYNCQNGGGSTNDASTNGWAPEALRLLQRKFGVETPQALKDRQRNWLSVHCPNNYAGGLGRCTYHHNDTRLSGNALVAYGWTEDEVYDPNNARVHAHVRSVESLNHANLGLYYMYASTKGLRSFVPEIKYLPGGRDWSAEFNLFLLQQLYNSFGDNGYWDWVGGWPWGGFVNTNTRTAMTTQILQSWLEVQAYARATPESAGPGIDITFDHSWSYVLDPGVSIQEYRWNVVDYPNGLDLDGDGRFDGEGEHAPEDRNGNGRVDPDEIVWDFVTADPQERFVFQYGDELGWDDVVNHRITLEVVDSEGRVVSDENSVRIQLSLQNHKPVIVPHPDGLGARYRGYIGTDVLLDGRRSYDVDSEHPVFPGEGDRPPGIPDRITSIHFDLNLDGDFNDPGEDGTNGVVRMTLRDGLAEGDLLSVPMRVCDDGQWNGKCYDGVQRADCSECSFGSAPVQLVRNIEPPVIAVGGPYAGDPGATIPLNLTGTRDPEGVLGLRYEYWIIEGRGQLSEDPAFVDVPDDMGPRPRYVPAPDGPRIDRIGVRVTDFGGLESEGEIRVTVNNLPPVLGAMDAQLEGAPPTIEGVTVQNLGNGWYRALVDAAPSPDWNAYVVVEGTDPGDDPLAVRVDFDSNGQIDANGDVGERLGPFAYLGGRAYEAAVVLDDGDGGTDHGRLHINVPPADPTLRFFFDLGADGRYEVAGGGQGIFDFAVPPGTDAVRVAGYVEGRDGARTPFDQQLQLTNAPPVFEVARVLTVNGFDVVVSASAVDPDGDQVTYRFQWGDGSPHTTNRGGIADHTYPDGQFRAYDIVVVAEDGRGGSASRNLRVVFDAPAANRPPTIDAVQLIREGGFHVVAVVGASDPDGDALTYTIDWGDGSNPLVNNSGLGAHDYPDGVYRAYDVTVTVSDGRGGSAQRPAQVEFVAPPANRAPAITGLQLIKEGPFRVVAVVGARDPDGDALTYTIDWGDGSPPTVNQAGIAAHDYPNGVYRAYQVRVTVEDGRGGTDQRQEAVDFPEPPPNRAPVIEELRLIRQGEWDVLAVVGAVDPDGDALTYTFNWGDGSANTVNRGGIASHVFPANVFRAYTITATVDDGRGGTTSQQRPFNFPAPADNQPPVITNVGVDIGARGLATVTVEAWDPEGGRLTYRIHWGDEDEADATSPLVGAIGSHRYELADVPYEGYVVVVDELGNETREDFEARITDHPTLIRDFSVNVIRDGTVLINVVAEDRDGNDFLVYSFDYTNDGQFDAVNQADSSVVHSYPMAGEHTVRVRVTDTWSGNSVQDTTRFTLQPWIGENGAPIVLGARVRNGPRGLVDVAIDAFDPEGGRLTYRIHWGDEEGADATEPLISGIGSHTYSAPSGEEPYPAWVEVTDPAGLTTRHRFDIPVEDQPTRIQSVNASLIREGTYLVSVAAEDGDGRGTLRYAYDFDGDGEWDLADVATESVVHTYEQPGDYTVIVGVTDPWTGTQVLGHVDIELLPWVADNEPPVIHNLELSHGPRGLTGLRVDASDPEGGRVDLVVHWGDEADPEALAPLAAFGGEHRYAFRDDGQRYRGFVMATDRQGASARRDFDVLIEDRATLIRDVSIVEVGPATYLFNVLADDADGHDLLRYAFDFDGDGTVDQGDRLSSSALHTYAEPGTYEVGFQVTDSWSGATAHHTAELTVRPWANDNQPPVIGRVEVQTGPRGSAQVQVVAHDPDGGRLDVAVHWGDEESAEALTPIAGFAAAHDYPYREAPYRGRVVVTDEGGAAVEAPFEVAVADAPTAIRQVTVSSIREGRVLVTVSASDPDSADLLYAFDFEGDGIFDVVDRRDSTVIHDYAAPGAYDLAVQVTDPWSGAVATVEHEVDIPPWETEAPPIDGDHLEGEEGRCLVLRVGDDLSELSTKVDPAVCERAENPDESLWQWDFGDGTSGRGSEVGHRYADDGIYEVRITGGDAERPRIARLLVSITNASPRFVTQPPVVARPGRQYRYDVRLDDPGAADAIRLSLETGPEGMELTAGEDDRHWTLSWDVPEDFDGLQVEVALRAIDGHGEGDAWRPDGGNAIQNFFITVDQGGAGPGPGPEPGTDAGADPDGGGGLDPADTGVEENPDGGTGPRLDGNAFTGSSCQCDVNQGFPGVSLLLLLAGLAGLRRRRR